MATTISSIKSDILAALAHPEAEDGLYLNNLQVVHEEESREPVQGTQIEILDALKELIAEGRVGTRDGEKELIFFLKKG